MGTMVRKNLTGMFSNLFESQINYLLKHSSLNFWGNISLASLILIAFYGHTDMPKLLIAWFGLTLAVSLARLYHNNRLKPQQNHTEENLKTWANHHILFTTLLSLLWGLAGVFLFPSSLIHQTLLLIALSAVLISSITTLAASRNIFYLQVGLLLLPVAGRLTLMEGSDYKILAVMLLIMGVMSIIVSHYIYKVLYELLKTQQQTQALAHTDQVTRLANRRFFDKHFKEEWRRASRDKKPLSLLMIDVDHFKLYNDNNGHPAGDQCLKQLAMTMKSIARRQGDLVARYGGEEFAILLPDTNTDAAQQLAEKLRNKIINLAIPHQSPSSLLDVVTVSIGVASCTPKARRNNKTGEDVIYPAMLLGAADRAMYQAKESGRNCVKINSCNSKATLIPLHKSSNIA